MNKLYKKNELTFAILWIVLYVVLFSVAENVSGDLGIPKVINVPLGLVMTAVLAGWTARSGLREKYGLVKPEAPDTANLFYLPLVVIATVNLWLGAQMKLSPLETALHIVSMLCVGFLEEMIFRGLLFKAISKEHLTRGVIISSVTFGIGHIVNLLNGADFVPTMLQICYAVALGYLFTMIFLKTGSLVPCIVTHGVINSLSAFAPERSNAQLGVISVILVAVALAYAWWIVRAHKVSEAQA